MDDAMEILGRYVINKDFGNQEYIPRKIERYFDTNGPGSELSDFFKGKSLEQMEIEFC